MSQASRGILGGMVSQSAMPGSARGMPVGRAPGLVSAVVLATYVQEEVPEAFQQPDGLSAISGRPTAIYCDVLTYSSRANAHSYVIPRVLVANAVGLHGGHVWMPRAATIDMSGAQFGAPNADPRNLDGDHVIVQFLDDNIQKPIITGLLPHPQAGKGSEHYEKAGHRLTLKKVDGSPELFAHRGTFYGVDKDGNFVLDTTRAHSGSYAADGSEVASDNLENGNVDVAVSNKAAVTIVGVKDNGDSAPSDEKFRFTLKDGIFQIKMGADASKILELDEASGKLTVKLGGASLVLDGNGAATSMTLGNGVDNVVLWTELNAWWTEQKAKLLLLEGIFNGHSHSVPALGLVDSLVLPVTGTATSAPPTPQSSMNLADLATASKSTKVTLPSG